MTEYTNDDSRALVYLLAFRKEELTEDERRAFLLELGDEIIPAMTSCDIDDTKLFSPLAGLLPELPKQDDKMRELYCDSLKIFMDECRRYSGDAKYRKADFIMSGVLARYNEPEPLFRWLKENKNETALVLHPVLVALAQSEIAQRLFDFLAKEYWAGLAIFANTDLAIPAYRRLNEIIAINNDERARVSLAMLAQDSRLTDQIYEFLIDLNDYHCPRYLGGFANTHFESVAVRGIKEVSIRCQSELLYPYGVLEGIRMFRYFSKKPPLEIYLSLVRLLSAQGFYQFRGTLYSLLSGIPMERLREVLPLYDSRLPNRYQEIPSFIHELLAEDDE
ncbi:MAG: hypothetical protein V1738_03130 [Patescibacteria group bacterium]